MVAYWAALSAAKRVVPWVCSMVAYWAALSAALWAVKMDGPQVGLTAAY